MTIHLAADGVKVVLMDIEGTTTPTAFVYDTLFPYARSHLRAYAHAHASEPDVRAAIGLLRDERFRERISADAPDWSDASRVATLETAVDYAEWLMARDSKSPGLKALQGLVWKVGYQTGELRGEVYEDVPTAMRTWRTNGQRVAIYSSGSVLAQKQIFGSTKYGDLTPEIDAYFDTAVGAKRESASYVAIARALGTPPAAILFLSDIGAELEAASSAGCRVALVIRPGNASQSIAAGIPQIRSFVEILP